MYILAFDHRGSFQSKLFGITGAPTPAQTEEIASYKNIIFDGFKKAIGLGVPKHNAGLLVDEQFGDAILRAASQDGLTFACPAEKSGQEEFDFEYDTEFGAHIERYSPTYVKVLVRYNPDGDHEMNQRQAARLKMLSDYCQRGSSKFLFELLVPALSSQMNAVGGDKARYDTEVRPGLMVRAMQELQDSGVDPVIWKLEGLETSEAAAKVAAQAKFEDRKAEVVVLGRGENDEKVRHWLSIAAKTPGFIGFAIGRTIFWEALKSVKEGALDPAAASDQIAAKYHGFYQHWESLKT